MQNAKCKKMRKYALSQIQLKIQQTKHEPVDTGLKLKVETTADTTKVKSE